MIPPGRPRRQEKVAQRPKKTDAMDAGLNLAGGLLPSRVIQCVDAFVPLDGTTRFDLSRQTADLYEAPLTADKIPDQPNYARVPPIDGQVQHEQAERWEHAVRGQLASITAPVRQDSENTNSHTSSEGFPEIWRTQF
jgi:hypothetical protein